MPWRDCSEATGKSATEEDPGDKSGRDEHIPVSHEGCQGLGGAETDRAPENDASVTEPCALSGISIRPTHLFDEVRRKHLAELGSAQRQ